MINRTKNILVVEGATAPYRHEMVGFEPHAWLKNNDNIALTSYDGENISLFEKSSDGIYTGHMFFVIRGKAAKKLALEMLSYLFTEYPVTVIRGIVPIGHLGSRWMARQLGFKSLGAINAVNGYNEMFYLTRADYMKDQK